MMGKCPLFQIQKGNCPALVTISIQLHSYYNTNIFETDLMFHITIYFEANLVELIVTFQSIDVHTN